MKNQKPLTTYEEAKEKALRLLEFRSHSEKELEGKLKMRGASGEIISEVLDFCRNYGFVNDKEFAKRKAKDLYNLKKYGKRRIEQELKAKGIPSDLIYEALSDIDFSENDLESLVRKKLGNNFEKKNIDKCVRYFLYRGYDFYEIKSCIDMVLTEEEYDL